jgi:hypothetical protein
MNQTLSEAPNSRHESVEQRVPALEHESGTWRAPNIVHESKLV